MIKALDYLDSIRTMEIRIQIKTRQVQHLRDTMNNVTAPMDKEQVSHTKNVSAMADTIAMIIDIEEEIEELRIKLSTRQKEIISLLNRMKPENASILSGRYIEGKTTKELGNMLFLSRRQIERRLKDAQVEFQLVLNSHEGIPYSA